MAFDANIFFILLEVFLGTILVVYIKIADDWALETITLVEEEGKKAIDLIKDIRADLVKLNKILNFIKDFKFSRLKNIITKIFDVASVITLLYPGGKKLKLTGFAGLRLAKTMFSLLKPA